jgi:hypothetical protein
MHRRTKEYRREALKVIRGGNKGLLDAWDVDMSSNLISLMPDISATCGCKADEVNEPSRETNINDSTLLL